MITQCKSTKKPPNLIHHLMVGVLPNDNRIEIFADRETKKVYFNKNGVTKPFSKLPEKYKEQLMLRLFKDDAATADLNQQFTTLDGMLERYTFCLHGDADAHPDIIDGQPAEAENFRCQSGLQCQCLKWKSKNITLDNKKLTFYQLELILALGTGKPDKVICQQMTNPITKSTLDTRKRNLYQFANVQCKGELIAKAIQQKIIQ